ncbi:hypothetical protein [Clostridium tyrobutyricum]|nr:hypothetical protein [Clostridium tyrobutyricum]
MIDNANSRGEEDSKIKIYSGLTRENDRFEGITNFRITQKL